MTERTRITSIELSTTTTGKPTVSLYGDTRLQFPVLTLFDASLLIQVGVNPADLTALLIHLRAREKTVAR